MARRSSTTRRSASIDSSRQGKALLVIWEDALSSEKDEVSAVSSSLQDYFGYQVVGLSLTRRDPETALLDQVQSLLDEYGSALNPFFLYYCGKAVVKHGKPFWVSNSSSSSVDWQTIQVVLENYKADIILALDCDYGNLSTINRDREGALGFHRISTRKDSTQVGKLEVIATLQKAPSTVQSFGLSLAGILDARQDSSLSVDRLLSDLRNKFGNLIIYENISPSTNVGKIEMIPMCPLPRMSHDSRAEDVVCDDQERTLVEMVKKWNDSSQAPIRTPAREGYYERVVVQPIIWRVSDWGARGETELMRVAFKKHFDYQVEETFVIEDSVNAQQLLEAKIQSFINQESTKALSENDLLIIVYNGHGMDGAKSSCNMMWEGGRHSRHSKPIDWTKIVRKLDAAPCDILQILDCCFGATATKSKVYQETSMLDHIHQATPAGDYQGTNEILASTGRDTEAPAGDFNSMRLFAEVLTQLAAEQEPISVYSWFYEVDSEAVRRNTRTLQTIQRNPRKAGKWWHGPSWKCHPKTLWPQSIILRPKAAAEPPPSQSPSDPGYIYAKIKIENGRPTDVVYYTQKIM